MAYRHPYVCSIYFGWFAERSSQETFKGKLFFWCFIMWFDCFWDSFVWQSHCFWVSPSPSINLGNLVFWGNLTMRYLQYRWGSKSIEAHHKHQETNLFSILFFLKFCQSLVSFVLGALKVATKITFNGTNNGNTWFCLTFTTDLDLLTCNGVEM